MEAGCCLVVPQLRAYPDDKWHYFDGAGMLEQRKLSKDATPLPEGMSALRSLCEARGGFFVETEHHMISYTPGRERLVVCFDNLNSPRDKQERVPFGFPLVLKQGWGVLGVMVKRMDWFQCPDLKERMEELKGLGLFDSYPHVAFYGSSMGGFGAMAFAPLAKEATVLAYAPQSTLRPRIAQFERRYMKAMKRGDWSGSYTDAARTVDRIGKAYMIYDPFVEEDRLHAERMRGGNVIALPVRHFTHKIPPMLKLMDLLKPVALEGLSGELSRKHFYHLLRQRRSAAPYLVSLIDAARDAGHTRLGVPAAERAVNLKDNWKTRQALKNMRSAQVSEDEVA